MLTVPEAAKRVNRDPETTDAGFGGEISARNESAPGTSSTESDLEIASGGWETGPLPEEWQTMADGRPMIDVKYLRLSREGR